MTVTRADLRGFSTEAKRLIMWAQEQGCRVRISKRGHAIILAPDGVRTASVARDIALSNRAGQNARADVRRILKVS